MQPLIIIKNFSSYSAISVLLNDELISHDILKNESSAAKPCPFGTNSVKIFSASGRIIYDLWLSAYTAHALEIYDSHAVFKTIPNA